MISYTYLIRLKMLKKSQKSVFLSILLMSVFAFGSVLVVLIYTLDLIEENDKANLTKRVEVAFDVESKRLKDTLTEYTYWDESHQRLIANNIKQDSSWAQENIGGYLTDAYGINLVLFGKPSDETFQGYKDGKFFTLSKAELFNDGFEGLFEQNKPIEAQAKHLFHFQKHVYIFSLNQFWSEETSKPVGDNSFMLFAKMLSEDYFSELSELYHLPSLKLSNQMQPSNEMSFLKLQGNNPSESFLTWKDNSLNTYKDNLIAIVSVISIFNFLLLINVFKQQAKLHKQSQRDLKIRATRDSLTGILNRRAFMEKANRVLSSKTLALQQYSLMMLDLDNFKMINDHLGHQVGDEALIEVSRVLQASVREEDIVGRFGGEEFIILLPKCSSDCAEQIAEKIRSSVLAIDIKEALNHNLSITVSIGISNFKQESKLEAIISLADKALYAAKANGKNQFVMS